LASTDVSEGQPHSIDNYPILIAGGGAGSLVHPGVNVQAKTGNASDVLLTLLQAMDVPVSQFGAGGGSTTTPVAALRS
jgi:hypothetical protein